MGVFFSAGWIPCVGPVLAAIYFLASDTQTVGQGALLLLVYSAGLGIPFLLTGALFSRASGWLRRMNRHLGLVSKITGIFLILVGVLLFNDRLSSDRQLLRLPLRDRPGKPRVGRLGHLERWSASRPRSWRASYRSSHPAYSL